MTYNTKRDLVTVTILLIVLFISGIKVALFTLIIALVFRHYEVKAEKEWNQERGIDPVKKRQEWNDKVWEDFQNRGQEKK
jgi:ABC-type branched-subunit amino acid transport system permease subunit